jgi:hypothetical protein
LENHEILGDIAVSSMASSWSWVPFANPGQKSLARVFPDIFMGLPGFAHDSLFGFGVFDALVTLKGIGLGR